MAITHLPPLSALRAFETAAQAGSFTSAAQQLFVTPAAISQQIRLLEKHLGIVLFERSKKGVKLTRAGESYLFFVHEAFEKLRQGQQYIEQHKNLDVLTITALPSIASKWLMPRVLQWMETNPEQEIRVEASHSRVDFNRSASDICISFGDQGYTGLDRVKLFTDSVSLVASPQLLAELPVDCALESLIRLPMIHVDWGDDNSYLPGWEDWLQAAGFGNTMPSKGPRFNLSSMAIEAAVQGKGLLLGQQLLIENELSSGQLVMASDIRLPLERGYYLVYPKRTLDNPSAVTFIDELRRQASLQKPASEMKNERAPKN
ncbi:MAG: LysR substrate-binding domain-containing protein [Amphritea sp.]